MLLERVRNGDTRSEFDNFATSLPCGEKVKSNTISLSRYDKIELVKRLDERGQFEVKHGVPVDAERFCFCHTTICNSLRGAHNGRGHPS